MESPKFPCGRWAWLNRKKGTIEPFKCGKATCIRPECKKLFWSRRVRLIQALVDEHSLDKFFTLTLNRDGFDSKLEPWEYIHHCWLKFRKRMNRRFENYKFCAILEAHKNDTWPHIHGFTNCWLSQKDYSDIWENCGGGPIVWVERVKYGSVGEYVGKELAVARYVGKEQITGAVAKTKKKRTLWRSTGLKAKHELTSNQDYVIVQENVFDSKGNQVLEIVKTCQEKKVNGKSM